MPAEIQVASGRLGAHAGGDLGQPREGRVGVPAERRDPHHARAAGAPRPRRSAPPARARRPASHPDRAGRPSAGRGSPAPGTSRSRPRSLRAAAQAGARAWPGRRDCTTSAYAADGGRLVALQLADEVPREVEVGALLRPCRRPPGGGSRRRRATPSSAQQPDVGGREELGDHDEGDLVAGRDRRAAAGGVDAALGPRPGPARDLGPRGRSRHRRPRTLTTPANRPAPRPVAAVGVEVRRLAGCTGRRRRPRRRRASSWARDAGPDVERRGAPGRRRPRRRLRAPRPRPAGLRAPRSRHRRRAARPRPSSRVGAELAHPGHARRRPRPRPDPARPACSGADDAAPRGRRAGPARSRRPAPSAPRRGGR